MFGGPNTIKQYSRTGSTLSEVVYFPPPLHCIKSGIVTPYKLGFDTSLDLSRSEEKENYYRRKMNKSMNK